VVWIGLRRDRIPLALFLDLRGWPVDLLIGAAAGGTMAVGWEIFRRTSARARALEEALRHAVGPLERHEAVALAALSAVAEEVFFRGAVQGSWGVVPATLLFAALHIGRGPAFRPWPWAALVAGAVLGTLALLRGNLTAPIVAHFSVNAVGLVRLASPPHPRAGRR